jgi:hypothetical protein
VEYYDWQREVKAKFPHCKSIIYASAVIILNLNDPDYITSMGFDEDF